MTRKHKRTTARTAAPVPAERTALGDLAVTIAELVHSVDTVERYTYWPPGPDHGEARVHRTSARGLLVQLQQAAGVRSERPEPGDLRPVALRESAPLTKDRRLHVVRRRTADAGALVGSSTTGSVRYDEGGHSTPGSRLPAAAVFVDEYARLAVEIWDLRRRLAKELGVAWLPGGDPAEALDDVLTLAARLPEAWQERAFRAARSWASAARIVLQYEAPRVALRDYCPECGGVLKVRADATSDVMCRGGDGVFLDVPYSTEWIEDVKAFGCGARSPRSRWVTLLTELNRADRARVEGQAWIDHAAWLDAQPDDTDGEELLREIFETTEEDA